MYQQWKTPLEGWKLKRDHYFIYCKMTFYINTFYYPGMPTRQAQKVFNQKVFTDNIMAALC